MTNKPAQTFCFFLEIFFFLVKKRKKILNDKNTLVYLQY